MNMKGNWESRKASIKKHHLPYLKQLAEEMQHPSISDVVDFVINQYKLNKTQTIPQQQHLETQVTPQDIDDVFGGLDLED